MTTTVDYLQLKSTLTDRYQTTIPETVRKALRLNKRDKIRYTIHANGQVIMSRDNQPEDDPVLGSFLNFLAQDIRKNPQHIQAISSDLVNRVQSLVADVEIDLDSPLSDEDEEDCLQVSR
jgi:antitoxin PrlF